jgi:hypothetical protein
MERAMRSIIENFHRRLARMAGRTGAKVQSPTDKSAMPKLAKKPTKTQLRLRIVSHPKCGRTWLAVMLSKVLNETYNLDMNEEFSIIEITKKIAQEKDQNVALTDFHHDSSCFRRAHRFSYLRHDTKKDFAGQHVILLVRDPRDVLVSSFHQILQRDKNAHSIVPDISKFIRDDVYGISKILAFYASWERNTDVPASFAVIRYEDMHDDPVAAVRMVLQAMGAKIDEQAIRNAVNASTFQQMQKIEREGHYKAGALTFAGDENLNAMKARKGKIGSYREELSDEDIDFLDGSIRDNGCAFYSKAELLETRMTEVDEAKLKKHCADIDRADQKVPTSLGQVRADLAEHAQALFRDGYVVIPNFVTAEICESAAAALSARLDRDGVLAKTKQLQATMTTEQPADEYLDGARVVYRASASKGAAYDTGMLIVHDPEKMTPQFELLKNNPDVHAIVTAARGEAPEHKGQIIYFNDSVTNPRCLHWDSLTLQFKAFLYLTDVNEEADGPYSFVKGTHLPIASRGENARNNAKCGNHPKDAFIYEKADLLPLLGKKGTLIISNQRGYHGGTPQKPGHRRIMLVQNYY